MIKINEQLKSSQLSIQLGIIEAKVRVEKSCTELIDVLKQEENHISENGDIKSYKMPAIENMKLLYRAFGKDPTRYRISSDSLFRRLVKNKGMYYVNNIVDLNNLMSLKTFYPIGAYDQSKIQGAIQYDLGLKDEDYTGIGRGNLNIENLPVLKDEIGPFGSSTSDSMRTMVTEATTDLMMVFYSVEDHSLLNEALKETANYLKAYAGGHDIKIQIIES